LIVGVFGTGTDTAGLRLRAGVDVVLLEVATLALLVDARLDRLAPRSVEVGVDVARALGRLDPLDEVVESEDDVDVDDAVGASGDAAAR
jgi:hypothetical protein